MVSVSASQPSVPRSQLPSIFRKRLSKTKPGHYGALDLLIGPSQARHQVQHGAELVARDDDDAGIAGGRVANDEVSGHDGGVADVQRHLNGAGDAGESGADCGLAAGPDLEGCMCLGHLPSTFLFFFHYGCVCLRLP